MKKTIRLFSGRVQEERGSSAPSIGLVFLVLATIGFYLDELILKNITATYISSNTFSNLTAADLFLVLAWLFSLFSKSERFALRPAVSFSVVAYIYFLGQIMALFFSQSNVTVSSFTQIAQVAYILLIVLPTYRHYLVSFEIKRLFLRLNMLIIGIAGVLAVLIKMGVYQWAGVSGHLRQENPILVVNGFILFAYIFPFIVFTAISSLAERRFAVSFLTGVLGMFGFIGMVFSISRSALGVVLLAGLFIVYNIVRKWRDLFSRSLRSDWSLSVFAIGAVAISIWTLLSNLELYAARQEEGASSIFEDSDRRELISFGLNQIQSFNSLVGIGLGRFSAEYNRVTVIHNQLLQMWLELGLPGLIGTGLLYGIALANASPRNYKTDIRSFDVVFGSYFIVIGFVCWGMFSPFGVARVDWVLLAVAVARPVGVFR